MLKFLILVLFAFPLYSSSDHYVIGDLYPHRTIKGGLGNQLFQVATVCAFAWDHNAEAYFPGFQRLIPYSESSYHHVFFRCHINPPSEKISMYWECPGYEYIEIPFLHQMKIGGYCQNERYFAHQRDRLIELFSPKDEDLTYIRNKYSSIIDHPNSVGIHIRYYHGEIPDAKNTIQYHWEYYEKAMAYFPDSALFVIFSDNFDFARKNIPSKGRNVVYIEEEPPYIDLFLQSMCKHNIICNSTFSWWGAWLNQNPNKIVIRPKAWMEASPDVLAEPTEWIRIDAKGLHNRNLKDYKMLRFNSERGRGGRR
jgi:Glycosyl transferase family 11